ncbi:MAG: HlyD family efflux transporter periplasmic adaptor subunit, partial [Alphaproteobacteria bacterium]|nr:HlyD family efflux transporter periplasmic adaptor subunit [Alphaproteobacteria bacterium]
RTVGGVVQPGGQVLEIVPVGRDLVAEVRISPNDIGQIDVGQPAEIKVSTYEFTRFGSVAGNLAHVSASTFADQQGRHYYRGLIDLDRDFVGKTPGRNRLMPGMQVVADIKTGERTVLQYLLTPIHRSLAAAMQEK